MYRLGSEPQTLFFLLFFSPPPPSPSELGVTVIRTKRCLLSMRMWIRRFLLEIFTLSLLPTESEPHFCLVFSSSVSSCSSRFSSFTSLDSLFFGLVSSLERRGLPLRKEDGERGRRGLFLVARSPVSLRESSENRAPHFFRSEEVGRTYSEPHYKYSAKM